MYKAVLDEDYQTIIRSFDELEEHSDIHLDQYSPSWLDVYYLTGIDKPLPDGVEPWEVLELAARALPSGFIQFSFITTTPHWEEYLECVQHLPNAVVQKMTHTNGNNPYDVYFCSVFLGDD